MKRLSKDVMRANLWSRTVSRFLVRLATFPARELSLLQRRITKLELTSFVPKVPRCALRSPAKNQIYHSGAAAERIAESLASTHGIEVVKGEVDAPELIVRIHRDVVTVSLDSSGGHLHQRGQKVVWEKPLSVRHSQQLRYARSVSMGHSPLLTLARVVAPLSLRRLR